METELLEELVQIIDDMIVQHDYPGFEPRALKLGLPDWARKVPAKTFAKCLGHESVFVRLAALRWFQDSPGKIKPHIQKIYRALEDSDPYVRLEAVSCLETLRQADDEMIEKIAILANDHDIDVQREVAKALGKLSLRTPKNTQGSNFALQALDKLSESKDPQLRLKAQKAIRKIQEK
ncbi:MAG: HEAT repeat domain-containing protein [Cyanobacteria bacterium TGS_CYA1]|nr:HEAT repeat domain-containing protein [Cyanobacteria bacterium TGS_CYA1]